MKFTPSKGLFIWWLLVTAFFGAMLATGGETINYMPGPLQPGQERPTY